MLSNCNKTILKKPLSKLWVSASKTRNYLLNDPIIDYFKLINNKGNKNKFYKKKKILSFRDYLLDEGNKFEEKIYNELKKKFKKDIVKICDPIQSRQPKYFYNTVKEMEKGTPIIYQGVLYNIKKKIFGCPDLIVRCDYINKIFNTKVIEDKDLIKLSNNNYHYRIIDIKNSKLYFNSRNYTLRNKQNIKPFKSQIFIYNYCLGLIQNYTPTEAYILGNGSVQQKTEKKIKNIKYNNNSYDNAGIIDFSNFDSKYKELSFDAITWINDLNKNYTKWNLSPPSNINLYPNMNNYYDNPYKKRKIELAKKNHEITNIWNCSIEHRSNAFNNNIYAWNDIDCNSKTLGIVGKNSIIIDNMLDFHRNKDNTFKITKKIENINNWKNNNKLSMFVDFETINNLIPDINTYTFMIGIGWNENNKWKYKNFTTKNLTINEEERIFNEFIDLYTNLCSKHNDNNPNVFHWSYAEKTIYNNLCKKYNKNLDIPWFDLLEIFKNNMIFIKDCYNFSLKNVGKGLSSLGLINTTWDDNITDGLNAMFLSYKEYNKNRIINSNNKMMNDVIKYNEIDCKILWDIFNLLKKY